ncbi:MAG: ATP-binding protein [Gemmatimonadaceae bacterium]
MSPDRLFTDDSEMSRRCRNFDWASTRLGPVDKWSHSLRTIVTTMLSSRHPMFLWWGPELIQIYNDGYRPSFGESGRDIAALGARGREHWAEIWPIIGPQIEGVLERGEATWHEDQLVPIERNGRVEDVYWTYGFGPVRDDDGSIAGVLVVVQETTQRVVAAHENERLLRELEVERERLAYVFQHAPAFLAVMRGPEHTIELANAAYKKLVGHRELAGKPIAEALPEVVDQGFVRLLDSVLSTGEPFVGLEMLVQLQSAPGEPLEDHYLDFTYLPLVEADGTRSGVIAHGFDVTQHVLTRREVEQAKDMAEAANRAKGDFLAVMSHELRTPLNAIGGYAELLELGVHGPINKAQRGALDRIQKSQRHLLGLINGVLNYTRVEAGALSYEIEVVSLSEVLSTCEALVAPQLAAKELRLESSVAEPGLSVMADREKLQQIVLNLLTNSIKFTEKHGQIVITCGASDDVASVEVSDTGRGIAADQIGRVFEPFVQVDSTFTRPHDGVGLGLAISRDLARSMGGDLTLISELGRGSTFTLTLPSAQEPVTAE